MTAPDTPRTLPVSEIFGPTLQGEGPSAGRLASFVRLGGCNLTCRDCDTPYTWDARRYNLRTELTPMDLDSILTALPDTPMTVISGGEPLLYQRRPAFSGLLNALSSRRVEIETNGTLPPLHMPPWVRYNVSPKLAGPISADPHHRRIVPAALGAFASLARLGHAAFKFVVAHPGDVSAALTLADRHQVPRRAVWVMPAGTTPDAVLTTARAITDTALAAGINLSLRQHVLLWPTTTRGR